MSRDCCARLIAAGRAYRGSSAKRSIELISAGVEILCLLVYINRRIRFYSSTKGNPILFHTAFLLFCRLSCRPPCPLASLIPRQPSTALPTQHSPHPTPRLHPTPALHPTLSLSHKASVISPFRSHSYVFD